MHIRSRWLVGLVCLTLLLAACAGLAPGPGALSGPILAYRAAAAPAPAPVAVAGQPAATAASVTLRPADAVPTAVLPSTPGTLALAGATAPASKSGERLTISFIDVGQGDSELIQSSAGQNVLIDGGNADDKALNYLKLLGVKKLDLVVFTHPHSDHIGGLPAILRALPVAQIAASGQSHTTNDYSRLLDAIIATKTRYTEVQRGDKLVAGDLTFEVLSPAKTQPTGDLNNNSVVLRLAFGRTSFLFEGDAQAEAEAGMLAAGLVTPVTVLKVAHHGSGSSSTPAFLQALRPQIAVYSAGAGNPYGHPHPRTIANLQAVGAKIYGTDKQGSIVVTSDGQTVTVGGSGAVAPKAAPPVAPVRAGAAPAGPTPAPNAAGLHLDIARVTSPVKRGGSAALAAQTTPGAACRITVYFKSGPSKAAGLGNTTAGANGACSWTWKIGSSTTPGVWRIVVVAQTGAQTLSKETSFEVTK